MEEKKLVQFENIMSYILVILLVCAISLVLSSCGTTHYNVGTGQPMNKHCSGAWFGGQ